MSARASLNKYVDHLESDPRYQDQIIHTEEIPEREEAAMTQIAYRAHALRPL